MHQFEEPRFNEEAQRRIIARAMELQRNERLSLSASELEASALEAGLDPRLVRQAIEEAQVVEEVKPKTRWRTQTRPETRSHLPLYVLGAFLFAQMYLISGTMFGNVLNLYVPFGITLLFGIAWSRTMRSRLAAYGILLATSALILGWFSINSLFTTFPAPEMASTWVARIMAMQAFLILLGQVMAVLSALFAKRPASRVEVRA